MKNFVLAVVRDGHIDQVLVRMPTISDTDDLKEALSAGVDDYFDQLEGSEDGE